MIYEYASIQVILGSGILGFAFNSGQSESSRNRIGFKTSTVWVGFRLSTFGSFQVWVISSHATIRVSWISLLRVFESKSVHPFSGVGSGMDSGLESVLPGLRRY